MKRSERTRFFIVSGSGLRWLERDRAHDEPVTLGELKPVYQPRHTGPKQVSFESAGPARHGTDKHQEVTRRREAWAGQIAKLLNEQDNNGEFGHVVLVAPPRLLSAIRPHLSRGVTERLQATLGKDLFKTPNHDLKAWLHSPGMI